MRRALLRDQVTVQTYTGDGSYGPVLADPVTVLCHVDARRQLVRNEAGEEVVASLTVRLHPETLEVGTGRVLDPESLFTFRSLVQWHSTTAQVAQVAAHTIRGRTVYVEVAVS